MVPQTTELHNVAQHLPLVDIGGALLFSYVLLVDRNQIISIIVSFVPPLGKVLLLNQKRNYVASCVIFLIFNEYIIICSYT
jgi:hypothetical protein